MPFPSDTISIVLAGGVGSRLSPLTRDRAKPAVPFGGLYRIIDFPLSNCLHSGLRRIFVLTQYKSDSLHNHLRDAWSIFSPELGEHITAVPPQLRTGDSWYSGTADAIYQNLHLLKRSGAKNVLILSGDHIYRMDYSLMLDAHRRAEADVTVACMEVDLNEAQSFGVMSVDSQQRIRRFHEKPKHPESTPENPDRALASMGIYVFDIELLCKELERDALDESSSHDFGKDLLPRLIHSHRVCGYRFGQSDSKTAARNHHCEDYWRDVGTIDTYFESHMDLVNDYPDFDLYNAEWPIFTRSHTAPPAKIVNDGIHGLSEVNRSLLSNGVVVSGGTVTNSVLSPDVRVLGGAEVTNSVLLDGVTIGEGAIVEGAVIDKNVHVPAGARVGVDREADAANYSVSPGGVVVLAKAQPVVS